MTLIRHLPRFKDANQSLKELEKREHWSRKEIEDYQLERINSLWVGAVSTVPYYAAMAGQHRLPARFRSLDEFTSSIPILGKATVRDNPHQFLSEAPAPGQWRSTGGSTGTPTTVFWPHAAHRKLLLARYRCQAMWGVDICDRQAMLWGHANTFAGGIKGLIRRCRTPLEDRLRGRLRLSAYRLSDADLDSYLKRMQAFRPKWIYGYSSAVYLLARRAAELELSFPSLRLVMVSGEPAYDWIVQKLEEVFRVPTISEYGSMECGNMAHVWKDRKLHVRDDQIFLETIPDTDGHFEIVVTVLNNSSFPLIRFSIGDLSHGAVERPERGFSILPEVSGRSNDMIVARSGRLVHPMGVKHVFEQSPGIRRFAARQDKTGQIHVQVEIREPHSRFDLRKASQQLSRLLEGYEVSIEPVDVISNTLAGKHRWIVSELAAQLRN